MKIVIIEPLGITPEKLAEATAAVKARGHEIVAYDTKEEDQDKLAERGKDADIIIIAKQPFRKNVIEKCKNLKLLSVAFTGVDHIDVDFCKEKGICVCNAAGYSTNAVAELAFGLAISVLRNIPACDAVCRRKAQRQVWLAASCSVKPSVLSAQVPSAARLQKSHRLSAARLLRTAEL